MTDQKEFIDAGSWIGRQQAFAVVASHSSAAQAACLKEMRDGRAFEKAGLTWEQFCENYVGISRMHADRLIGRYTEFGETYFRLSELAHVSPETYRHMADKIHEDVLEFEDEQIPLTPNNAPKIRAAVKKLRAALRAARDGAKERPSLTVREFQMRVDTLALDIHNTTCSSRNVVELQTMRDLCAYALRKWQMVTATAERFECR